MVAAMKASPPAVTIGPPLVGVPIGGGPASAISGWPLGEVAERHLPGQGPRWPGSRPRRAPHGGGLQASPRSVPSILSIRRMPKGVLALAAELPLGGGGGAFAVVGAAGQQLHRQRCKA